MIATALDQVARGRIDVRTARRSCPGPPAQLARLPKTQRRGRLQTQTVPVTIATMFVVPVSGPASMAGLLTTCPNIFESV